MGDDLGVGRSAFSVRDLLAEAPAYWQLVLRGVGVRSEERLWRRVAIVPRWRDGHSTVGSVWSSAARISPVASRSSACKNKCFVLFVHRSTGKFQNTKFGEKQIEREVVQESGDGAPMTGRPLP
jgi:hypothetical protein